VRDFKEIWIFEVLLRYLNEDEIMMGEEDSGIIRLINR